MHTITIKVKIPDWARYYAQDADGAWVAYDQQPTTLVDSGFWDGSGRGQFLAYGLRPADWTKESHEVIRENNAERKDDEI